MSDSNNSFRSHAMHGWHRRSAESRHFSTSIGNDFTDGNRGDARSTHGAKKWIRTRIRFHDRQHLRNHLDEYL